MSSIEHLKEEARRFEQEEKWGKALELYSQAIDELADSHQPDIALFNRSGDLATKIGSAAQAVSFYERAVDFYMDAGLPNNAIAVCKKVMRNLPDRNSIHLKMGQIRARQGLLSEARTSFVTYAERVQASGDLDEAFRALIEFVSLAPDDYEIGMMLASQLEQNDRKQEAVTQYVGVYRSVRRQGLSDLVDQVAEHIKRIDPQLDLENAASDDVFVQPTGGAGGQGTGAGDGSKAAEVEIIGPVDLPLMSFDDDDDDDDDDAGAAAKAEEEAAAKAAQEATAQAAEEAAAAKAAEEAAATVAADAAAKAAEEAATVAADAAAKAAEEAATVAADTAAKAAEDAAASAAQEAAEEAAAGAAEEAAAARVAEQAAATAKAAAEQAAATTTDDVASVSGGDPATDAGTSSSGQYVDLGAVLLGEEVHTGKKKSTRFVVPYEEPTGDDQADFDKMLAQFREKVSENIEADDSIAHYDLGTAYMEMGLLDEAISEFQMVLRGTSNHLPTYEMLGKTFLQKEEPEAALRSLTRGLDAPCEIEEDRVGIYYYMALSHETKGDKDMAIEFYDRVFAIDINFADVTERLKTLRG